MDLETNLLTLKPCMMLLMNLAVTIKLNTLLVFPKLKLTKLNMVMLVLLTYLLLPPEKKKKLTKLENFLTEKQWLKKWLTKELLKTIDGKLFLLNTEWSKI